MEIEAAEIEHRLEHFKATAKEAGIKLTPQRLEIFQAVASSMEHPSAESVLREIPTRMPTVSLDTVYRTLWTLTDLGLLTTLGPRHGSARFDANLESHHHYICTSCGLTRDFTSEELCNLPIPKAGTPIRTNRYRPCRSPRPLRRMRTETNQGGGINPCDRIVFKKRKL